MTQFELAKRYMTMHVNKMAECVTYGWSSDFIVSEIKGFPDKLKSMDGYESINPNNLTKSQLFELGGKGWGEDLPNLVLIPIWMLPHLPEEFKGASFSGEEVTLKTSELDNDHRFGCLAYGVILED